MANTSLFTRLQRLFSTDVIIRNQGGNELKVLDVDSIQRSGDVATNSLIDRFNRIYSPAASSLYGQQLNINYQYLRTFIYSDYDIMDQDAIIASALDIIAEESTLRNEMGEILQIRSSDEDIQQILYNLFYDVLNVEFNLWSWIRQMCKYGDFFLKLEIAEKYGVYNVIPITAYHIERQENYDREHPNAVRFMYSPDGVYGGSSGYYPVPDVATKQKNDKQVIFDNYEIAHFRLMTDVNYLPYGRAYIEPARRLYKQYALMEDAMLIHRITRSPDRRVFKINVGSIPPNEVDQFMQKTISTMKRTPLVNEQTGEYNLKYNSQNLMEDFYIPVRGNDTSTSIENLSGLNYDGIADVNYLRDKLFAALRVPKAFMGYDENLQGKATLAAEDIRFARTIDRIQRIILSELYKIAIVHLYTQGYTADNLANFELNLTTPSIIYDQERIALMKEKMDLAAQMLETKLVSSDWIYENVFHFSQDQYEEMRDLVVQDQKRAFRFKQIGEEGNDPLETGKSYGTPHDLASLYGRGRYSANELPDGYDEKAPLGRPKEKVSNINTQDNAFGRDRLGRDAMKNDDQEGYGRPKKDVSPLALEIKAKNKTLLESLEKKIVFNKTNNGESLLDESNLKE
jgi:NADPH-dependent 7-cyano-7-deazaguanine reductase QueF-like protein